ncbi:hypothetical protein SPRG_05782 [Saprolegnia parasitica CBS 223.65]|uniref:Pentacotripeptide-repeat region of PRORP domain-containing protein n=1 Tax=Saprolegnia parasitica (strain CBS 223.65) TaxID=695850 RepID=A0A067CQV0_SAPPC|nr:hypothetical protein SPRG_05782 [Saprolegnia parasitica CBS 223.65]KDO28911.1 hypothetical protein SPRG_05782 [Saprolegnia parasitica CBS 223.65]|eukprot:XP_012200454.1 hypothetical protein SPRG_05782 [Saprolegnia parasitica CBS 223.65]
MARGASARLFASSAEQVEAAWSAIRRAPTAAPVNDYVRVWYDSMAAGRPALTQDVWMALEDRFPHELSLDMFEATAAALLGHDDAAAASLYETQVRQRADKVTDTFRDIAIRAYCNLDQVDDAMAIVRQQQHPDMHMQARVLYACARLGRHDDCDELLRALDTAPSSWTAKGCDNVLRALGSLYPIDRVFEFFSRMLAQGILPTPTSVRLLVQACLFNHHHAHLERLLHNIPKLQLPPDAPLVQAQIAGHVQLGHALETTVLPLTATLATAHAADERTLPTLYDVFYTAMDRDDLASAITLLHQLATFPAPFTMLYAVLDHLPKDATALWAMTGPLLETTLRHHGHHVPSHLAVPVLAAARRAGDDALVLRLFHALASAGVCPNKTTLSLAAQSCKALPDADETTRRLMVDAVNAVTSSSSAVERKQHCQHPPVAVLNASRAWDPMLVSAALSALGQVEDLARIEAVFAMAVEKQAVDARVETQYVRLLVRVGRHVSMKALADVLPKTEMLPMPLLEEALVTMMRCKRYKVVIRLLPQLHTRPETYVAVFHEALTYARSTVWLTRLYEMAKHRARLPASDVAEYQRLLARATVAP